MILAIGLQESQFIHRQQLIGTSRHWWQSLKGPAVSFFQFERAGINGVLRHHASREMALVVLDLLGYPEDVSVLWRAMKHNDLLAACFARLALWRLPERLPMQDEHMKGWDQYIEAWRPGKPHPERWADNYLRAWDVVLGVESGWD
jgi:hypothetical protein